MSFLSKNLAFSLSVAHTAARRTPYAMKASKPATTSNTYAEAIRVSSDVLQLILDLYDPRQEEDRRTLQALSLVSRFFAARCQAILFREIFLCDIRGTPHKPLSKGFIPIGKRCKLLMRLLKSRPHLVELIQRVKVGMSGYEKGLGKITEFQALLAFLSSRPGIPGFQTFHLKGDCFLSNNNSFENNILYPLLATRITSLFIDSVWDLPIAVIAHCENLEDLTLNDSHGQNPGLDTVGALAGGGPKLKTLRHTSSVSLLERLVTRTSTEEPFLDLRSLNRYETSFRTPSLDGPLFATICALSAPSLKSVYLTVGLFNEPLPNTKGFDLLDFSHCRKVDFLKMELRMSLMKRDDCQSRLYDITSALQTFPKSNDLQHLILQLHIHSAQYHPHYLTSSKNAWIALDSQLARISDHKPVSIEVLIKCSTDVYHPTDEEMANELEGILRDIDCFALTRARQGIRFRLTFEFVNACYSNTSYCRRLLHY